MTFDHWINEVEGYSVRHERAISDIRNCVAKGKTDDIIKWLMAAYTMGHEQGYDVGYYDANEEFDGNPTLDRSGFNRPTAIRIMANPNIIFLFDEYQMGDDS